jgi:ferredoxin
MRVSISEELCSGQGRCWKYAPNVYDLDDAGFNVHRGQQIDVPEGKEKAATMGMKACPERAITMVEP